MLNSPGFRSVKCSLYCVSSSLCYVKSSCCWHLKTSTARLSVKALTEPSDCCRSSSPENNDFRYQLLSPQKCPSAQGHHRGVESGLAECSNEKGESMRGPSPPIPHPPENKCSIYQRFCVWFYCTFYSFGSTLQSFLVTKFCQL